MHYSTDTLHPKTKIKKENATQCSQTTIHTIILLRVSHLRSPCRPPAEDKEGAEAEQTPSLEHFLSHLVLANNAPPSRRPLSHPFVVFNKVRDEKYRPLFWFVK